MIGKFENEEALLKSYTDLEKEFTKKCQELSKLKKEIESEREVKVIQDVVQENEVDAKTDSVTEIDLQEECESADVVEEVVKENVVSGENVNLPQDDDKNEINDEAIALVGEKKADGESMFGVKFRAMASEFLRNNTDARPYAKEISKILLKDKSILSCSDPFGVAYALVLKNQSVGENKKEKPIDVKEERKIEVQEKGRIPATIGVLGRNSAGFSPSRVVSKFRTMEDARSELLRRFG